MKRLILYILLLLISNNLYSQFNGKNFSVALSYNYTTTSKLFLQPNSEDPFVRGSHENLDDLYSYSLEFRYRISDPLFVGLSFESIKKTYENKNFNLGGLRASMTDGYKIMMSEFSFFYLIPFSTEMFKFYMGGGVGLYLGEHIRHLGDTKFVKEKSKLGYGINVAVGMDYLINEQFSIRGQLRFRDPEVEMTSKYADNLVHYDGRTFSIPTNNFRSKANIDGITFTIGAAFNF
jgi:opacity protein-like surface antigen